MEKKEKISGKELAWYIVAGVIALFGFSLFVTHIVGALLTCSLDDNSVYQAEVKLSNAIKIPFTFNGWGWVFMLIGLLMFVLTLYHWAKKDEAVKERDIKRRQRLAEQLAEMETPTETVVEVEAKEEPKAEPATETKEEPASEASTTEESK